MLHEIRVEPQHVGGAGRRRELPAVPVVWKIL
jgi:hypothetical protein